MNSGICIVVPAHNEAACILNTLASLQRQTLQPEMVVVIDDGSTDGTGDLVREHFPDVVVVRPAKNTGSKAGAQNFALFYRKTDDSYLINSKFVSTIDADTKIDDTGLEHLFAAINKGNYKAVGGMLIPQNIDNFFTFARTGEYLSTFAFTKPIQEAMGGKMPILSGAFGLYDTDTLRQLGGWTTDTLGEDMDLTARLHQAGHKIAFVQNAVARAVEPCNWHQYSGQMARWSRSYLQNISKHWKTYGTHFTGFFVIVGFLDAGIASVLLPLAPFLLMVMPVWWWLKFYVLFDIAFSALPILYMGRKMHLPWKVLLITVMCAWAIKFTNSLFFTQALWAEWIFRRHQTSWVKGH